MILIVAILLDWAENTLCGLSEFIFRNSICFELFTFNKN